jgi:hypothetical protein
MSDLVGGPVVDARAFDGGLQMIGSEGGAGVSIVVQAVDDLVARLPEPFGQPPRAAEQVCYPIGTVGFVDHAWTLAVRLRLRRVPTPDNLGT